MSPSLPGWYFELDDTDDVGKVRVSQFRIDDDNQVHTGLIADLERERKCPVLINGGPGVRSKRAAIECLPPRPICWPCLQEIAAPHRNLRLGPPTPT